MLTWSVESVTLKESLIGNIRASLRLPPNMKFIKHIITNHTKSNYNVLTILYTGNIYRSNTRYSIHILYFNVAAFEINFNV